MSRVLMILEVSQKQAYIFRSRKLAENLRRSNEIRAVTDPVLFTKTAGGYFDADKNMVYTGGGHTVLQFDTQAQAQAFGRAVSTAAMQLFPDMELFISTMPYDESKEPKDNLIMLSQKLEEKKSRREASFHTRTFGIEKPEAAQAAQPEWLQNQFDNYTVKVPEGWSLSSEFEKIAADDNFIGVVHIDGNSMGRRVQQVYDKATSSWGDCVNALKAFSDSVDDDFAAAYTDTQNALAQYFAKQENEKEPYNKGILPMRKIIGAGDDVCFVTAGKFAIEAAAAFLNALSSKKNKFDEQGYAACAGVVLIHTKDPFREAYDLSEELCSSAKRFGAGIDEAGRLSVIDWHIEFGQPCIPLGQLRKTYWTRDGGYLNLRPYVVVVPADLPEQEKQKIVLERKYGSYTSLVRQLRTAAEKLPRTKLKELRAPMHDGEIETMLAIRQMSLLPMLNLGGISRTNAFETLTEEKTKRCLYFDAIEMMDHIVLWREEGDGCEPN